MSKRSPDLKWEAKTVAYIKEIDKAIAWETKEDPMVNDVGVLRVLIWHWPESKNILPTNEDLMDGIYWFEREHACRPDKIILPRVIGSQVFGVEVECQ